jgi:hypothetical protein
MHNVGDETLECLDAKNAKHCVRLIDYLEEKVGAQFHFPQNLKVVARVIRGANKNFMEHESRKMKYQKEGIYGKATAAGAEVVPVWRNVSQTNEFSPATTLVFDVLDKAALEALKVTEKETADAAA